VNPGDRAAACGGLMEPIGAELKSGEWIIRHRCVSCGFERKNKTVPGDDFDAILQAAD
jgi:hypothetical protein